MDSNGGGASAGWFLNLEHDPVVTVQVKADHHTTRARVATAEKRAELWRIMTATGTPYEEFQAKADHKIPWWSSNRSSVAIRWFACAPPQIRSRMTGSAGSVLGR